jgi:DmsE family decaheme c-type cytochrome
MVSTRHVWRTGGTLAAAAAVAFVLFAVAGTTATTTAAQATPAASAATPAAGYAGEDTCLTCHEGQSMKGTAHGRAYNENSPAAAQGCESCHGPGQEHAEAGGDKSKIKNPSKMSAGQASDTCTTCHNRSVQALWNGSQHDNRQVGCLSCHSVHTPVGEKQIIAKSQTALCGNCHRAVANKQYRFNHMPVREGKMNCSSCHNVHGSTNVKLLKAGTTIDESCVSCHAEKRGPFLWDHAPVSDSCTTCHDPHGSNNDRMLVAKQPFLCQRCHVTARHPPTVYEGYVLQTTQNANKIYGKSCVSCHQLVHGSNAPGGKAFLR